MTPSFKFKKNLLISLITLAILLIGSNIILNSIFLIMLFHAKQCQIKEFEIVKNLNTRSDQLRV